MSPSFLERMLSGREALADKPSFYQSEISAVEAGLWLSVHPKSSNLSNTTKSRVPLGVFQEAQLSQFESLTGIERKAILYSVDGYEVNPEGMKSADCTCGKAPIWVYDNQISTEPRKKINLLSKLGLDSRTQADFVRGLTRGKIQGLRFFTTNRQGVLCVYGILPENGGYLIYKDAVPQSQTGVDYRA